ncbi:MAG: hypothetical protein DDT19_01206 [Syntrophomonadaceae bacterium]|nr:hypothetical protein [Bacillota bacterium]
MRLALQLASISTMLALPTLRHPLWHITISVIPTSFFFVFWLIGGINLGRHALLGSLVALAINAGIVSLPQLIVGLKHRHLQDMFVASPVGPVVYALGTALSRLFYISPLIIIALIILTLGDFVPIQSLPMIALTLVMTWLVGSLIGFTAATYINNIIYVSGVSNLLGLLLNLIPPVYYPLSLIPHNFQWLALLIPTTHAAQLIRAYAGAVELRAGDLIFSWSAIVIYGIICALLVVFRGRWRET